MLFGCLYFDDGDIRAVVCPEAALSFKALEGAWGRLSRKSPPSYPIVLSCVSGIHSYLVQLEQAGLERFAFRVQLAECGIVGGVEL